MSEAVLNAPGVTLPPTQDELPCDDGMPMETARHRQQLELLIDSLHTWLDTRPDGYAGGNMFIHFSLEQVRKQSFRGPDFFLVLGVPKIERKSWVVWEEGKGPDVVIELLSATTAKDDKTVKRAVYQDQLRVSEYFWYDPFNPDDWTGFKLNDGKYEPLMTDDQGRLLSPLLNLALVRWRGLYGGIEATWLRWATLEGELLPTRAEAAAKGAEAAKGEAEAAKREAEIARQQAVDAERRAVAAEAEIARLQALLAERGRE
jgi:Uma2 family endonuclease